MDVRNKLSQACSENGRASQLTSGKLLTSVGALARAFHTAKASALRISCAIALLDLSITIFRVASTRRATLAADPDHTKGGAHGQREYRCGFASSNVCDTFGIGTLHWLQSIAQLDVLTPEYSRYRAALEVLVQQSCATQMQVLF